MENDVERYALAFDAFESQLKTLCLKEFPCGLGPWKEPDSVPHKRKKIRLLSMNGIVSPVPQQFTTVKEPTAQMERTDVLQELVSSHFSPWHLDYSWSKEARQLREIAVKTPWLVDTHFVRSHFRTLSIVDKGVTELDDKILLLHNLQELTLTANAIKDVCSKNLPRSLKVLELCANEIIDISRLCLKPPRLHHLGLGRNNILFIGDYITGSIWPDLLSLDLCYNNLTNFLEIIQRLSTLPKLRNLILMANPFCLLPSYRGFTIDSLPKLSILDDIRISAEERHHFKGLAGKKDCIKEEIVVTLEVTALRNIPVPEEIQSPEDQLDYPVMERSYLVQFMYPVDKTEEEAAPDTAADQALLDTQTISPTPLPDLPADQQEKNLPAEPEKAAVTDNQPTVEIAEKDPPSTVAEPQVEAATPDPVTQVGEDPEVKQEKEEDAVIEVSADVPKSEPTLAPIWSTVVPWTDDMQLEWREEVTRADLRTVRDFFKNGMDISIVEQMVLISPPEVKEETTPVSKKNKGSSKDKLSAKGKEGKKKKGEVGELVRQPPILTPLATFHLPLAHFLEGDFSCTSAFTTTTLQLPPSLARSPEPDPRKDKKKGSAAQGKGKDDKKGKGKKGGAVEDGEQSPTPPPQVELEVGVYLHHWTTATDSLKKEKEEA